MCALSLSISFSLLYLRQGCSSNAKAPVLLDHDIFPLASLCRAFPPQGILSSICSSTKSSAVQESVQVSLLGIFSCFLTYRSASCWLPLQLSHLVPSYSLMPWATSTSPLHSHFPKEGLDPVMFMHWAFHSILFKVEGQIMIVKKRETNKGKGKKTRRKILKEGEWE